MKAHSGINLSSEDVDYVYGALLSFAEAMNHYRGWVTSKHGKPLPAVEIALKELAADTADILRLQQRIYDKCFVPTQGNENELKLEG